MADLTYREALADNELVASGAGVGQENIDGTQVVGATGNSTGGFKDSGWTFNSFKNWVKLDADWMSKSVYDSGGDGRVDNAEQLNDGTNTVTAAQARGHIDDSSIHFVINDGLVAANVAWSSTKINSELSAKADQSSLTTHINDLTKHLTPDQNDAVDGANAPNAGNVFATIADVIAGGNGDVSGPASSVNNNLAAFNGTTGKLIKDAGYAIPTGGATNYSLRKNSATDFDFSWSDSWSNVIFTNWAGFATQGSTAISVGGTTNINFSASNKHALTGTGSTTIGTLTFPQANAHYFIVIPSTITIAAVSNSGKQEYGQNDLTPGRAHIMAIYWDGTTVHWQTSEAPS